MNYHKYVACKKGWVNPQVAKRQKEFATVIYERYPKEEDCYYVRFSDDVHLGYGTQGKLHII